MSANRPGPTDRASPLERALRVFSDVRAGEGTLLLVMTLNVFVVMVGYYILKTVREPLILASGGESRLPFAVSGSEGKAYAASAQALCLVLAIINPPEAAILAVGAAAPEAVVIDGQVAVRNVMRVTLSADHRVVDGATAAEWLKTFRSILEQPLQLFDL